MQQRLKKCKLGVLLDTLTGDELSALETAIRLVREDRHRTDATFTIAWLAGILRDNGYDIGKTVVSDHVREVCVCVPSSRR